MILTTLSNSYTTSALWSRAWILCKYTGSGHQSSWEGCKMVSLDGIPETGPVECQRWGYHFQKGCAAFKSEPHYSVSWGRQFQTAGKVCLLRLHMLLWNIRTHNTLAAPVECIHEYGVLGLLLWALYNLSKNCVCALGTRWSTFPVDGLCQSPILLLYSWTGCRCLKV